MVGVDALHARSFTDFWEAPALKDNGAAALDKSPPSTVIRSLAAPSTCRKTAVGLNTLEALSNTSLVSMNRSNDSAFSLPCTLKPFTADSFTCWRNTDFVVLTRDFRNVPHGGVLGRTAARKGDMHVMEADVFKKTFAHAV